MQFENQFTAPWYPYTDDVAPKNAKPATYVIGTGDNTLTITYGRTTDGNGHTLTIALASGADKAMSVADSEGALTITLGTDADSAADATKNTYALIAVEIKKINGYNATVAGSGAISEAAGADEFTAGQFGTACPVPGTFIRKSDTEWYTNIAPNSVYDANWRKLTVATY
jgi:hypothetical protein